MLFTALVYAALSSRWLIISIEPSLTSRHAGNTLPHGLTASLGLPSGTTAPAASIAPTPSDLFSAFPDEAMAAQEMRVFREPLLETAAGPADLPMNTPQTITAPPAQGVTNSEIPASDKGQNALQDNRAHNQPDSPAASSAYFAPSPTSGTVWMAHAGSYRTRKAAFSERSRLAKAGFSAEVIVLYDTRHMPWYSLIAGAGTSRRSALAICSQYTTLHGTQCTVRSFPAPKYRARAEQARR